jgi:biopolymer transport protein ExbB/TolQ
MNTQLAFAFGMLAMVAITMLVVIVVGIVKVIKLEKQYTELNGLFSREVEHLYKRIAEVDRDFLSSLTIKQNRFEQHIDELRRDLQAYTDSRIDKALGTTTTKKQILKD